jgi:hypothetical protein
MIESCIEALPEDREEREEKRDPEEKSDDTPTHGPLARIARELAIPADSFKNLVGIKGDSVDFSWAGRLPIADASSAIRFAFEKGLGKAGMSYETFQGLVGTGCAPCVLAARSFTDEPRHANAPATFRSPCPPLAFRR